VAHGISVKFGLWTFHKLLKRQKKFHFIDFWFPLVITLLEPVDSAKKVFLLLVKQATHIFIKL